MRETENAKERAQGKKTPEKMREITCAREKGNTKKLERKSKHEKECVGPTARKNERERVTTRESRRENARENVKKREREITSERERLYQPLQCIYLYGHFGHSKIQFSS